MLFFLISLIKGMTLKSKSVVFFIIEIIKIISISKKL